MKRGETKPVDDIVRLFLRESGLETPLNEARAVNAWPEIVGQRTALASRNVRIYNQKLYVEISSPALRNNLFMQRKALVKKINGFVGADVISDIIFR
jgi:hypothetical protein